MKIESVYKHFLLTRATHLPVIGKSGTLLGLLPKSRILQEKSQLTDGTKEWESLPIEILERSFPETLIQFFRENTRIPVLNELGERIDFWDKPKFMQEVAKLDSIPTKLIQKNEEISSTHRVDPIHWFMELILSHTPDGMIATDITGNTIFYNPAFEKKILSLPLFKNSISLAEKLLKDWNKELIASHLKTNDLKLQPGNTLEKRENGFVLRMVSLEKEKKLAGFLYQFTIKEAESNSREGDLDSLMFQFEKKIISEALHTHKQNISHSAKALGIPRTTLQNRMKFLSLQPQAVVIPRNRNSKKEAPSPIPKKAKTPAKKAKPQKKRGNPPPKKTKKRR